MIKYFIRAYFRDNTSYVSEPMYPAEAHRKFIKLKKNPNTAVVEEWMQGNPGESDPLYRYSRLLRAWDYEQGRLDGKRFHKLPLVRFKPFF